MKREGLGFGKVRKIRFYVEKVANVNLFLRRMDKSLRNSCSNILQSFSWNIECRQKSLYFHHLLPCFYVSRETVGVVWTRVCSANGGCFRASPVRFNSLCSHPKVNDVKTGLSTVRKGTGHPNARGSGWLLPMSQNSPVICIECEIQLHWPTIFHIVNHILICINASSFHWIC